MSNDQYRCPTCDGYIPNNETPGAYPGALSRRDNLTEVCSECGLTEAIEDFMRAAIAEEEKAIRAQARKAAQQLSTIAENESRRVRRV